MSPRRRRRANRRDSQIRHIDRCLVHYTQTGDSRWLDAANEEERVLFRSFGGAR